MDSVAAEQGIGDDELNKMIANLQGGNGGSSESAPDQPGVAQPSRPQPVAPVVTASPAASSTPRQQHYVTPPVQPQPANRVEPNVQNEQRSSFQTINAQSAQQPTPNDNSYSTIPSAYNQPAGNLEDIKRDAINELKPLVTKLNIPAADKFDTLLLLIRSTDDSGLLSIAHETATQIEDDSRRAQALLDVIKEIDFFNNK